MEKLDPKTDGASTDIVGLNIEKLKQIFPEVFNEGMVDFGVLRETLGDYIDDRTEKYSFSWNGKFQARRISQTPSTGTMRPCIDESVDWDRTQNLFIEGDNLEVLKLLQKSYHKKIKLIYIDPPYNTGKEFIYPDNYKDNLDTYLRYTGQKDAEGHKFSTNTEAAGRYHTNWLNMMYPRLRLARNLLRDDGVIFISIDDHEVANLRKLCDEIFGEENFVASNVWQKRYSRENRGIIGDAHEYLLVYSRYIELFKEVSNLVSITEKQKKVYKNSNSDPLGPWRAIPMTAQGFRPNQMYEIESISGKTFKPPEGRCWSLIESEFLKLKKQGRIYFGKNGDSQPGIIRYLSEVEGVVPWTWWPHGEVGHTDEAKKEIRKYLGKSAIYDTPKPVRLLQRVIEISMDQDDIVLDFFSGSCTTAHAAMILNRKDKGERKFVMVQLPEPCNPKSEAFKSGYKTIADIGKERIRRAIKEIKDNNEEIANLDLGFKVFKLDSSNIKPWDADFDSLKDSLFNAVENIKLDRSETDLLYELLLKYGLDLAVPIEERQIAGETVYIIGAGALIVCLADMISLKVVEGISALRDELKPEMTRVVFKDSGFKDDVVKTNSVQILRQAGIDDVKSL